MTTTYYVEVVAGLPYQDGDYWLRDVIGRSLEGRASVASIICDTYEEAMAVYVGYEYSEENRPGPEE